MKDNLLIGMAGCAAVMLAGVGVVNLIASIVYPKSHRDKLLEARTNNRKEVNYEQSI